MAIAGAVPLLSIVVPTRNEAASVAPLWNRLETALATTAFDVCFVDDSDDETPAALRVLEERHPGRVHVISRAGEERAGGLSTAVVAGLRIAPGLYVCVMDADLQHPPETIPGMLAAAQGGSDIVVASRYAPGSSRAGLGRLGRTLASRLATLVARGLFSEARRSTDPLSGFFLCRRTLLDGIEFRPVGFKILLELLVCVPSLRVHDVALDFAPRAAGESKASLKQGALYLGHLWSLFTEVEGSARFWKFALVGVSGLAVFLPLLALSAAMGIAPLVGFLPAFAISLGWNTILNRLWTFADQRRSGAGDPRLRYLERALVSGLVMFTTFGLLVRARLPTVIAGLLAALTAMLINGLTNRRAIHLRPHAWSRIAIDQGVQAGLAHLAAEVGADRAYLLPARRGAAPANLPGELLDRVIALRRPSLWTEATSHRPQRRTNIDVSSTLLVPVVSDGAVLGVVVCEQHRRRGFEPPSLETATRAAEGLIPALAGATGHPPRPPDANSGVPVPSSTHAPGTPPPHRRGRGVDPDRL